LSALAILAGCTSRSSYPAGYHEYAYVSNTRGNTVSVLDVLAFKKIKDVTVGAQPTGIATNPHKNEVYVVNAGSNSVSVVDAERNEVVATIPVGKSPYFIDISPNGKRGLVANSGDDTVSVLDLDARRVTANIPVGKAPGLVRSAEGADVAVVSERNGDSVSVIDLKARKVRTSSLHVCAQPTDLIVMPDGSKAFVACSGSHQIAVVGLDAHSDKLLTLLTTGNTPVQLILKPDTGEVFATNFDSGTISEVLTGGNEVQGTHYIGSHPTAGVVSRDNSLLYVSNFDSGDIAIYSIDSGKVVGNVTVGSHPDALALSSNQNFLLVANSGSNDVAVIRTRIIQGTKPTLFTFIPVGPQPGAIAIKFFMTE
jgi:YVTN family beta-propeller protein